jgi:alpha-tubulin suppressor-like RCC1 family protein
MNDAALGGELAQLTAEYQILGELGRGGSAVVYRGRDRGLGRDVAIKVVHPRPLSPDDDAVARLSREARTVAQLQHPNIVSVFAVRRLTGGGLALVMQLVPGRTLKAIVQQDGPLSIDRFERVLRDVASALAYAHARGVVHRDVKPENIFVDEETGRAMLSDFGIARSDEHDSMTLTGTAIGTPFYMSPEQIDGGTTDGRSDLYSLGLVCWEMLTGQRPWDGESLYNVIYKQKHEELAPIEALRSGVPPRLQYIVERMLQKNPAARWAGAEGMLAQLSHTVLPGDYSRWQATLRKRVERYRAAERDRERNENEALSTTGGIIATTMRFVRSATGGAARTSVPPIEPGLALSDTMAIRPDGSVAARAPAAVPVDVTESPVEPPRPAPRPPRAPAVARVSPRAVDAPTWARPRSSYAGRWALALGGVVFVGGVALVLAGDRIRALVADRDPASASIPRASAPATIEAQPGSGARAADGASPIASLSLDPGPSTADSRGPTRVVLALGGRHSCVVTADGGAQCWGANERGQLGDGSAQRRTGPVRVAAALHFFAIASGSSHSCGVTGTGDVYCWGNDASGQLGDATTIRRNAPVRVAGPGIYRSVRTGEAHTCAITVEGGLHCWGANAHGQLGDGTRQARSVPGAVAFPAGERIAQLTAGSAHTCALTTAGRALCWGSNASGQLGIEGAGDRTAPTPVAGDMRFTSIAAGQQHTCALTVDGQAWCWGSNTRGQLGIGSRASSSTPQRVKLDARAVAIASGATHSCALLADGSAFCWGSNGAGQLGTGTLGDGPIPMRVRVADPLSVVAAGATHTCAVTARGALLCWGGNAEGQLGDASRLSRSTPTPVVSPDSAASHAAAPSATAKH